MNESTSHFLTLLITIIGGLGVISMGIWRVAAAVFKLAAKVDLLAYRMELIESRQPGGEAMKRRRPAG